MIELPASPAPRTMQPTLLDYGSVLRGAAAIRIERPGSRYSIAFEFPPMKAETAAKFTSRLQRAKREGLRVYLPLLVGQGIPGAPVVDGAGQSGTALSVRGFTPGYYVKEGFWFTAVEADGTGYLHTVVEAAVAAGDGTATIQIEPPLRAPFADGDTLEFVAPWIEGFLDGENWGWEIPTNKLIAVSATVEEFA